MSHARNLEYALNLLSCLRPFNVLLCSKVWNAHAYPLAWVVDWLTLLMNSKDCSFVYLCSLITFLAYTNANQS